MNRFARNFLALAALFSATLATGHAAEGYYRQPAISNDSIVFVAEGDLWRTALVGGAAQRLTTNLAAESSPAISHDGKWIAFTARYEGPAEVYLMPVTGGAPTRLTFDGDIATVQGWTPEGKVLYSTPRYSGKPDTRLYTIDPVSRVSTPIPLHQAAEGCYLGSSLFFARQEPISDNVKRYQGGLAQKIWRFDGLKEAAPLTADHAGTSRQPLCGNDRVYFISDRDGTLNIWSMSSEGRDLKQHTRHTEFDVRGASISADGKRIAYQRGADIHVLDTTSNVDTRLSISLQSDFEHTRTRWVKNPWDFVSAIAPSPTGDRVAITARGQVFVMPVGNGRRVEVTRTSDVRAREGVFSHDGKSLFTFADKSGEVELWRFPANGVGEARQLTFKATVLRYKAFPSPDGKWVAHFDKDRHLYLLNLASGADKLIDRSKVDAYEAVDWSPDSRWIVFNKSAENQFESLHLLEIATGKITQLTSNRYDARDAAFSPDGKWLFFLGDRSLRSVVTSPWGQRNPEPFFDRQTRIYGLALDPQARWPFLPKDELQKPELDKKPEPPMSTPAADGKTDSKGEIKNDTDTKADEKRDGKENNKPSPKPSPLVLAGLTERLYEVPTPAGNYRRLATDGKRLYFVAIETTVERKLSLRSMAIEAPNPLPPTVELFFDEIRSYELTQDRKKLLVRKANDLFMFDVGKSAPPVPEHVKFAINLRDWSIPINPREEWRQMFVDAWRMHRDYFFDKNMHGADWLKARARYEPLMARVTDRSEVNDVIAQMSAEAVALHSQVGAADLRKGEDTVDVAGLGAELVKTAEGFRVARHYGGDPELLEERSPLARPEVNIKVGDIITTVNGVGVNAMMSVGELLRNQAGKQVLLGVSRTGVKSREVIVTPITARADRDLRYLTWEQERSSRAEKASGNRIGYVHLQAMGAADIARWAREFYPVFQRDGLIIDLRHNRGGNIDSWIIEKLQRRAWHFWQSRQSDMLFANQQLAFRGHVVALIDGATYSDGETMAEGLK
ncbi:MAG: PDZ domain-containing protein, partial [Burkholderiales bacterium]|nr:PDZ domain-containing protein [Burkholderiales bacterium]